MSCVQLRSIKLIALLFSIAGLVNLIRVFNPYTLDVFTTSRISDLYQQSPQHFYFAASALMILLGLIIIQAMTRKPVRLYRQYRDIDSNTLDTDQRLSFEFYKTALQYRVKFGTKKFQRHIIKHFDFFYDYHNYALEWIDEVVSKAKGKKIPQYFILSAITSGHTGRVYLKAHYATGLPASNLKENTSLIFHDCAEHVEIWSYQSRHPLCRLIKNTVRLQTAHRHPNYLSAILTGINTGEQNQVTVELRFLTRTSLDDKQNRSEVHAKQNLLSFHKWLKQASKTRSRFSGGTGIDVSEIVNHNDIFTTPLVRHLEQLVYRKVTAYYPRSKLPLATPNIALDALVLCNGIGVIAITEKQEQGNITYSGDPTWYLFWGENALEIKNPCIQANLAKSSLGNLLSGYNLTRWPIISLVVYSKEQVTLNLAMGTKRLQCPVLKLDQLENWINQQHKYSDIQFTQNDITLFNSIMSQKQPLSTVI
ncbi:MAG: hypothetical protein PVG20_07350 [Thioalkalispiraceae bacterium]